MKSSSSKKFNLKEEFLEIERPTILVIGGFDPSGAAGVLADVKTSESQGVLAQVIISTQTIQNDNSFEEIGTPNTDAMGQLKSLLKRTHFKIVKIGMIPSFEWALPLIDILKTVNPDIQIIWDPILKASFAKESVPWSKQLDDLGEWMSLIDLITPNLEEAPFFEKIYGKFETWNKSQINHKNVNQQIQKLPAVLVKGGHAKDESLSNSPNLPDSPNIDIAVTDILYVEGQILKFSQPKKKASPKRGTGCVLASLIASKLAHLELLPIACQSAQIQMAQYLKSSQSLIGTWTIPTDLPNSPKTLANSELIVKNNHSTLNPELS